MGKCQSKLSHSLGNFERIFTLTFYVNIQLKKIKNKSFVKCNQQYFHFLQVCRHVIAPPFASPQVSEEEFLAMLCYGLPGDLQVGEQKHLEAPHHLQTPHSTCRDSALPH